MDAKEPLLEKRERVGVSKTMSHALRHEPWLYELELDEEGWTPVLQLLTTLQETRHEWQHLTITHIEQIVDSSDKKRFEIEDGKIRAHYGHSLAQVIRKQPAVPPELLFHGTSPETVSLIAEAGLLPMARQYVHCSADRETATLVGKRKAACPVILEIDAGRADQAGVPFYLGNELIWLADQVPPEYIRFPIEK
ncbi:RNA 2'-phosphotransferase [Polystyrenella longa]|uniref:Probable RNA 2'-phosphotransferase n=1 Tax=Polystyrenella longa TaxID=2528007 RepID=A0A518CM65_9PLAN|nr:RNA 2'-phosphotransferase [Polystyrenella longa]QDU80317.1 RNA 2'-phosphotransferase [Polystyrenella longa]